MALKSVQVYKNRIANAAVDNTDFPIAAGKTVVILAIDFTAPAAQAAGVKIIEDPAGINKSISEAQGDKVVTIPSGGRPIVGGATVNVRISLDNSNNPNAARLGATVYYDEL